MVLICIAVVIISRARSRRATCLHPDEGYKSHAQRREHNQPSQKSFLYYLLRESINSLAVVYPRKGDVLRYWFIERGTKRMPT